jgi:integrase
VAAGNYVHASRLTLGEACAAWLASEHALKPSTVAGHRVSLAPLRSELGHIEIQKLTKADRGRPG